GIADLHTDLPLRDVAEIVDRLVAVDPGHRDRRRKIPERQRARAPVDLEVLAVGGDLADIFQEVARWIEVAARTAGEAGAECRVDAPAATQALSSDCRSAA